MDCVCSIFRLSPTVEGNAHYSRLRNERLRHVVPGNIRSQLFAGLHEFKDTLTLFEPQDQFLRLVLFAHAWQGIVVYSQMKAKRTQLTLTETRHEYL